MQMLALRPSPFLSVKPVSKFIAGIGKNEWVHREAGRNDKAVQ